MSEESVEEVKETEAPIQDALEHVYTELGFALAKRAKIATSTTDREFRVPIDFQYDLERLADAIKNLSGVMSW